MKLNEYIDLLKDKSIAVIGMGVSNTPLIKRLLGQGYNVIVRDKSTREQLGDSASELEASGARLILGEDYLQDLDEDVIFRTPGLHPHTPELKAAGERGSVITSEMEAFFKVCPCKIIAVTGSDGKTTTTSIMAEILRRAGYTVHLGGNIGTPLLCNSDDMSPGDISVLELSSFQLMTMTDSPDIAVITNISPNHLDVHKDMAEYTEAKKNIFLHQNKSGRLILNADNEITASFAPEAVGEAALFSRRTVVENGVFLKDGVIYAAENGTRREIIKQSEILIPGVHNAENYMAAFAALSGLVGLDAMRDTAMAFRGVEHRIEHVRTLHGVEYYNDSIASSPSRTEAGLNAFEKKVILIAGGKDKGVPFDGLGIVINERVKTLVLTGLTAGRIRAAVENAENYAGLPIYEYEDFAEAVRAASDMAEAGDIVILSPACTSFDKFKNFAQRGERFKEIVNSLE